MVWFGSRRVPRLNAYLVADLTAQELGQVHEDFWVGSFGGYSQTLELFIKDGKGYRGKTHAEMRRAENQEGRTEPFLVIDRGAPAKRAVWYIDRFASDGEVEDGEFASTNAIVKIFLKTVHVPIAHANYKTGNTSIRENLNQAGIGYPTPEDFDQKAPLDYGMDMVNGAYQAPVWIVAEPGEWEETRDEEILNTLRPKPERMGRLTKDAAKSSRLKRDWSFAKPTTERRLRDEPSDVQTFPQGSVTLQLTFDRTYPARPFVKVEGSL